jgi:hypothetical protein
VTVDAYDEPLSAAEFEQRLAEALAALDGREGDEMRELVLWFLRRYPTPLDRLRYARRKQEEALRFQGIAGKKR